jgi:hypothetical protein
MEMEIQQLLERLLAGQEETKANQSKAEANMERQIGSLASQMKADKEETKANQPRMEESLKEEMRLTVSAIEDKIEAAVHSMRAWQEETMACQETMEACLKEWESEAERREVPMEEAAVKYSGITKKQHRGRHMAAGWSVKPKKPTHGDCGSRGRLVAACWKVSRQAALAWHRRNIFRDIWTQGNCGLRQELGAAGIMVTLRGRLAWRKGTFARKDPTRDYVEQGACKEWAFGERHRTKPTGSQGVKNRAVKEQLRRRSERTQQDLREKDQAGYREVKCQIFCQDWEHQGVDTVEG